VSDLGRELSSAALEILPNFITISDKTFKPSYGGGVDKGRLRHQSGPFDGKLRSVAPALMAMAADLPAPQISDGPALQED
jgi:hypothetical protein